MLPRLLVAQALGCPGSLSLQLYVARALCCQGSMLLRLYAASVQCCPSFMLPTRLYVAHTALCCPHGFMLPLFHVGTASCSPGSVLPQFYITAVLCCSSSLSSRLYVSLARSRSSSVTSLNFFFTEVYSFVCVCVCLYLSIYLALNKHVKKFVDFSRIQTEVILQNLLPDTCG